MPLRRDSQCFDSEEDLAQPDPSCAGSAVDGILANLKPHIKSTTPKPILAGLKAPLKTSNAFTYFAVKRSSHCNDGVENLGRSWKC